MLPDRINLERELLSLRNRTVTPGDLLDEIRIILALDEQERNAIREKLNDEGGSDSNDFVFELLESDKIFHLDHIKAICIDYRLRFLDSNRFKAQVPEEAISKIKALEEMHDTPLSGFKIVAPSKLFHLDNYDDPLLFVPIGNNYYYLIHKWGRDMSPYRKFMVRPMRDLGSLLLSLLVMSFLLSLLVSDNAFGKANPSVVTFIAFLFIFKALCGVALYYCFWKGKNFNTAIWDSNYYNH